MACEWLRTSYTSEWNLYSADDIATHGQYCFCPETTPHYSGWHNFGSRNWTRGDPGGRGALGELPNAKQRWHNGMTPYPYPLSPAIGSTACFADGEAQPPEEGQILYQGFPSACYIAPPAIAAQVERPFPDIGRRDTMSYIATVLARTYDDMPLAASLMSSLMGLPNTVTIFPNDDTQFPGMVIVSCDEWTWIAISGTTNPTQWALQILYPTFGAVPYANYETSPVWRAAAVVAEARVTSAIVDAQQPILLTGHSYGGVVATLMAADYRSFNAVRRVDLWTMGMPRPGSNSMNSLLDRVRQIHVANDNDPVPGLPPIASEFGWIGTYLPPLLVIQWDTFASPRGQRIMDEDGVMIEDGTTTASIVNVLYVIAQVLADLPIDPGLGHSADEYLRRLLLPV